MPRLLIHVEGQTEEDFVNEVLRHHLVSLGYESVSARIIGNARLRQRRGGIRPWPSARRDIIYHLRGDAGCIATTMVDFYGLPKTGDAAWPGRAEAAGLPTAQKGKRVEEALKQNFIAECSGDLHPDRFIPFVVVHEFEGLLFSDCNAFARAIGRVELEPQFLQIRNDFETPEDINDAPTTCPSRRVKDLIPGYEKPLLGNLAALEIGMERIRGECPHFDSWLQQLESLLGE